MEFTGNEGSQGHQRRVVLPSAGTQAPHYPPVHMIPPSFYPPTRAGLPTPVYPPGFFTAPRPAGGLKVEPSQVVAWAGNFVSVASGPRHPPPGFSAVPKSEPLDDAGPSQPYFNPFIQPKKE